MKAAGIWGRYYRTNPLAFLALDETDWIILTAATMHAAEAERPRT